MSILEDIRKASAAEIAFGVFVFIATLSPGVLAIWAFSPHMIETATTPKLILLAASFMVPLAGFNTMVVGAIISPAVSKRPTNLKREFMGGGLFTVFGFTAVLFIAFIANLSLHAFLWLIALLEIGFVVAATIFWIRRGGPPLDTSHPPEA